MSRLFVNWRCRGNQLQLHNSKKPVVTVYAHFIGWVDFYKNELQRTHNGVSNQNASCCQHNYSLTSTMKSTRLSELGAYLISSLITVHVNSLADTVSYFYHGDDPFLSVYHVSLQWTVLCVCKTVVARKSRSEVSYV